MEEILASIRRIIADDEAKPPAAEKPPEPAKPVMAAPARPAVTQDVAPPKAPAAAKPAPAPPPPQPAAAPPANNSQDDIDALLAGLEIATSAEEIRPAPVEPAEPEVLELTDEMAVPTPPPPQPSFQRVEPQDDIEFAESPASRAVHRQPAYEPPVFDPPMPKQPILSQSTVSAVESAFNTLAHTVLSNNARTLEDLVKEMLRPMLKAWLDDNLPGLVERIVKAEIERVSRGR
jgi:cell pole-organizing protein PopZ